jgi:transposase
MIDSAASPSSRDHFGNSTFNLPTPTTMPQGKQVSDEIQWIVVRLNTAMSTDDIAAYTDLSERKVRDILVHFKQTGEVKGSNHSRPKLHRTLCDYDIEVFSQFSAPVSFHSSAQHLFNTLNNMPDLYLDELRLELLETCGVSVSLKTIWKTLRRGGYSMKKVFDA